MRVLHNKGGGDVHHGSVYDSDHDDRNNDDGFAQQGWRWWSWSSLAQRCKWAVFYTQKKKIIYNQKNVSINLSATGECNVNRKDCGVQFARCFFCGKGIFLENYPKLIRLPARRKYFLHVFLWQRAIYWALYQIISSYFESKVEHQAWCFGHVVSYWHRSKISKEARRKKNNHHCYDYIMMIILMMTEVVDSELWG